MEDEILLLAGCANREELLEMRDTYKEFTLPYCTVRLPWCPEVLTRHLTGDQNKISQRGHGDRAAHEGVGAASDEERGRYEIEQCRQRRGQT